VAAASPAAAASRAVLLAILVPGARPASGLAWSHYALRHAADGQGHKADIESAISAAADRPDQLRRPVAGAVSIKIIYS
jgi:hypothetical protein